MREAALLESPHSVAGRSQGPALTPRWGQDLGIPWHPQEASCGSPSLGGNGGGGQRALLRSEWAPFLLKILPWLPLPWEGPGPSPASVRQGLDPPLAC